MTKIDLPYLKLTRARGKLYAYYRRGGQFVRINAEIGSTEFLAAYQAVHAGYSPPGAPASSIDKPIPGSFKALWLAYTDSSEWRGLAVGTQNFYRHHITPLLETNGHSAVNLLTREFLVRRADELSATPRKANCFIGVMRMLMNWAIDRGWRKDNPANAIKAKKTANKAHRVWSADEIAVMTGPEAGPVAIPVLIGLFTAQRLGDVLAMRWTAYDGEWIRLRQESKQQKTGAELDIPVHPTLRAALDSLPRTAAQICTRVDGVPWNIETFKHRFMSTRAKLGMPKEIHFHGLRHSAASWLAESGATIDEIRSITGHKTTAMASHYTQGAAQKVLARSAMDRLVVSLKHETSGKRTGKHRSEIDNKSSHSIENK
jgi:integrase